MIASVLAAPLSPDADQARELLERELSDPAYAAAEPTFFDRIAQAVGDFLAGLFNPAIPDALGPAAAVIAIVVVVIGVVVALLIWGRPRGRARAAASSVVFATDEVRPAAELRALAQDAAAAERWNDAIVLRFRAVARALAERVVVDSAPGATAQSFARHAARAFPDAGHRLTDAAGAFDDVRYLRRPGNAALYAEIVDLDDALGRSRPEVIAA